MRSRFVLMVGICAACGALTSFGDEAGAPSLLPKTPSRLKPVTVVAALEVPFIDEAPAVAKQATVAQAVALEMPAAKSQVAPVSRISATIDEKSAPVVPSWTLPKPAKKATPLPMANPYVAPRTLR